jgi:citrate lyase subunit beta / citryl-CoA lyase
LASAPKVDRLIFGSVDFASDAGMGSDGEELNAVRTHLVLVSRLAGVRSPVDGVTLAFADEQALANDVARARRMGMGAKLCIHPKQVAGVNQGFAPSATELQWAQRVLQQWSNMAWAPLPSTASWWIDPCGCSRKAWSTRR